MARDCFLKFPLFKYKYTGQMAAMVDQSDGKVIKQIKMMNRILLHCGSRSVVKMTIRTTDQASDHMTLVILKNPFGRNGSPPAKLFAKCEIKAKMNNLAIYFLTFRV